MPRIGKPAKPVVGTVDVLRSAAVSPRRMMPAAHPLPMPAQDFATRPQTARSRREGIGVRLSRAILAAGTLVLTSAFCFELHRALAIGAISPLQWVFLALSTATFAWIALGSTSTALGLMPLLHGEPGDLLVRPRATGDLHTRTAILLPAYHEDPARIAATVEALAEELAAQGRAGAFDFFVLSDSRTIDTANAELRAIRELRRQLRGMAKIYYRRRAENTAKKAGNIQDWVERYGGAYAHFVILDGDSVMSGATLVRLALALQENAQAGLIQTVPRLAGARTIFQRLQQFAANVYGPASCVGLASWQGARGNYWGHNAIIRTTAFASAAGLPLLPGKAPFGGHIQSHDFVEAALLQRAGWGVFMVPTLEGSYEGAPPSLTDIVTRDRRWAQGNMQHLALFWRRGLTGLGRVHLAMGAMSYLVSAVWATSLIAGVILALQGRQMLPTYFQDEKTLFPIWPLMDPGAAVRLFAVTMIVVLAPKIIGLTIAWKRSSAAHSIAGTARLAAGTLCETIFSMLFAPVLMLTQTAAVLQILGGKDSGWAPQRRDDGHVSLFEALRFHRLHMIAGAALAVLLWYTSVGLLAWMSPIVLGLLLSGPLTAWTSREAGPLLSALLSAPALEPELPIVSRTQALTGDWAARLAQPVQPGPGRRAFGKAA